MQLRSKEDEIAYLTEATEKKRGQAFESRSSLGYEFKPATRNLNYSKSKTSGQNQAKSGVKKLQ